VRSRDIAGVVYTHNVLMGIHVYFEAILFAFPQYLDSVVHEVIVVDPRSFMLKSFPSDRVAQYVKAPTAQTGEMNIS